MAGWQLEHSYAGLPAIFHSRIDPTPVRDPRYVVFNTPLALALGLNVEELGTPDGAAIFAGNQLPDGAKPLAQAYAGHQFGHFTVLGDGRAILLGEQVTPEGERFDIQLKGAGQTPYSRRGDGRAALGPMLRELIVSEAIHALGIPTTRSLAVVSTGEPVYRERPLPGAVLTRVAASHLRVGTFQWAAAHSDVDALLALVTYTIDRHYPSLKESDQPALSLLEAVIDRQAALVAQWQLVGFIHGVMNTDNMSIAGETIDFGPCAFMDAYDPDTVFSSIDAHGRYAYGNQPGIAQWNLARLAETLLPLLDQQHDRAVMLATDAVTSFADRFTTHWRQGLRAKLGLSEAREEDERLSDDLLTWMKDSGADFTDTFSQLSTDVDLREGLRTNESLRPWHDRWRRRVSAESEPIEEVQGRMRRHNPRVIARNYAVETAIDAATNDADLEPLTKLLEALGDPYDYERARPVALDAPVEPDRSYRTFCGT